jgi:cyclophilin family peptidyl-prolyl cis-trans isomerase
VHARRLRFLAAAVSLLLAGCPSSDDDGDSAAGSTGDATTTGTPGTDSSPPPESSTGPAPGDSTTAPMMTSDTTDGGESSGSDSTGAGDSTGGAAGLVTLETTLGDIVIELDETAAPITTANFLAYVESGFYDGTDGLEPTVFHRVIPGFVIQGGGLDESLMGKATMPPIVNESGNGLTNQRGFLSMARTADPDSATSQFFINVVDNGFLDDPPGYAVFGEVVEGMDVVDMIVAVPTQTVGPYDDVPIDPIVILSATVQ